MKKQLGMEEEVVKILTNLFKSDRLKIELMTHANQESELLEIFILIDNKLIYKTEKCII